MPIVIYHNPRCSTSRKTLDLLRAKKVEPTIIEYLKTPLTAEQLRGLLKKLRLSPRELMRKKESVYGALGLDKASLSDDRLIAAMAENPILIERPIVVNGAKAALGRPPERVLEIL